ncbi:hypothetical protein AVEN_162919-1, partial [Araneus ventricosus]
NVLQDLIKISQWLQTHNSEEYINVYSSIRSNVLTRSIQNLKDHLKNSSGSSNTLTVQNSPQMKRDLPHAHIPLTLNTYSKIPTKDDIDKYVSAELPDPIADPTIFQIITRCMIHGPCGTLNPNSPCMREGVCTKQYPKEFRGKTEKNINGYPMYQRKCIESVRVGHYAASIRFENENTLDHDEILSLLDGRYVSAPEAVWCLNEFNLSEKSHTVLRLAVHLPDQQAIIYQDGQEEEAVARTAKRQTTLTAWFELNKIDQDSHNYLCTDIPHYYTFNKSAMKWQKWQ